MRKYNKNHIHDFRALAGISNDTEMYYNVHVKQETQECLKFAILEIIIY